MIPSILITAVTSTTLFSTLGMDDTDAIIVIFGTLLVIGTILQSIKDLLNPSQLAIKNGNIAKQYTTLLNEMDEQLTQEYEDRDNGKSYMKKIKTIKNDLVRNSPNIPSKIWKKF